MTDKLLSESGNPTCVRPPSIVKEIKLSKSQVKETKRIASVSILVEGVIKSLRDI